MRQFSEFEKRLDVAFEKQQTPMNDDLIVTKKANTKPQTPTFYLNFAPNKGKKSKTGATQHRRGDSQPVSLLKLIVPGEDGNDKNKDKPWRRRFGKGRAPSKRKSSRGPTTSKQSPDTKTPGASQIATGQSVTRTEQSEGRSSFRK